MAFALDAVLPVLGAYVLVTEPETGETVICAVLAVDGQDCGLALPAHGLLAVWRLEDLIDGEATA